LLLPEGNFLKNRKRAERLDCSPPGLPDGIQPKKSQFGYVLDGLEMTDVGIFCGHSVNFPVIWNVL
jgi:hypothetical protein